jgi:23S rRNA pseudouridine2605 synthase
VREEQTIRHIGLARALSKAGYCSRSRAAELIRSGRVSLDGKIRRNPETPVSDDRDRIAVDGKLIKPEAKVYVMMNKPRGVVTTAADEKGRETVYALLNSEKEKSLPWLAPVGRLDKASEGLLLLTNDSEWGARIAAPETQLDKTYHVQLGTVVDDRFVQTLIRGVQVQGEMFRAKRARRLRAGQKNCWLEIILDEGKNRQIRRMMEALGVEVLRLIRVAIGPLQLGNLAKGAHRSLTADEKRMLDRSLQKFAE